MNLVFLTYFGHSFVVGFIAVRMTRWCRSPSLICFQMFVSQQYLVHREKIHWIHAFDITWNKKRMKSFWETGDPSSSSPPTLLGEIENGRSNLTVTEYSSTHGDSILVLSICDKQLAHRFNRKRHFYFALGHFSIVHNSLWRKNWLLVNRIIWKWIGFQKKTII